MDVPNRITQFCENAPGPPTEKLAKQLRDDGDGQTLLVSVSKDGNVLGTSWPVFREQVSLELGIPDMKEAEAASLLLSPKCKDDLRAFRDRGVRPAAAEPTATRGCARCDAAGATPDLASALTLLIVFALRPRRRASVRKPEK